MSNGIAYAKALLDISKENNIDINQIVLDLQHVNNYFDDEFISFLKNPKVSKTNKKEVFEKAFSNIDKNVFATLMILIDNNKIVYLCDVIRELELLIAHEKGITIVEVISAVALSDAEKEKNRNSRALKKYFAGDRRNTYTCFCHRGIYIAV